MSAVLCGNAEGVEEGDRVHCNEDQNVHAEATADCQEKRFCEPSLLDQAGIVPDESVRLGLG